MAGIFGYRYGKNATQPNGPQAEDTRNRIDDNVVEAIRDSLEKSAIKTEKQTNDPNSPMSPLLDDDAPEDPEITSKYDNDPRMQYAPYRFVGVMRVVTAKAGETLESISLRYLGPNADYYLKVFNDNKEIQEGDEVKIPLMKTKK